MYACALHCTNWNSSYRWLWDAMWVLGHEPWASTKAVSALNHRSISSPCVTFQDCFLASSVWVSTVHPLWLSKACCVSSYGISQLLHCLITLHPWCHPWMMCQGSEMSHELAVGRISPVLGPDPVFHSLLCSTIFSAKLLHIHQLSGP